MNTTTTTWRARVAGAVGALALSALALAAATPASAVELGPNFDPDQTGSISLYKYAQPDGVSGLPNNGRPIPQADIDAAGLVPIAGATSTLQRVGGIDLATNAGWDTVENLTAAQVLADQATYPLTLQDSGATGTDGGLNFAALPVGVYLVTETDPGDNEIAQPAAPFLITIPLPTGEDTWLYDVTVYPKSSTTSVTKTVDDSAAHGLGDDITWTITGQVPYLAGGVDLTTFRILDELDARLNYTSATVSAVTADGTNLTLTPSGYTLSTPAAGTNGAVDLVFNATGRAQLQANQGAVVTLSIDTEVASIGDGTIENSTTLYVNDPSTPTGSTTTTTNWGALRIFKYTDTVAPGNALEGAEFQLFTNTTDAAALTNPVSVNGATTFTTDSTGNVLLSGLKAGDYQVVETQAPVGYQASSDPIPVTITVTSTTTPVVLNVENTQVPEWALPLTGGNGTVTFIAAGGALLALALGGILVGARRRKLATA